MYNTLFATDVVFEESTPQRRKKYSPPTETPVIPPILYTYSLRELESQYISTGSTGVVVTIDRYSPSNDYSSTGNVTLTASIEGDVVFIDTVSFDALDSLKVVEIPFNSLPNNAVIQIAI